MTESEALALLGVPAGADQQAIRAAYRRLLRSTHPDLSAARDATERTVELTVAYDVLTGPGDAVGAEAPPEAPRDDVRAPGPTDVGDEPTGGDPGPEVIAVAMVDDDTIGIAAPPEETFMLLLDACHRLGEVAYLDRSNGLVEVVVEFIGAPTSSVVLSTQGRSSGITEVMCSVEPLSGGSAPPSAAVTRLMLDTLLTPGDRVDRG